MPYILGKNVILLPMGACDDGAHSQNEKINIKNYIEGTKLLAAYIDELSKLWNDRFFKHFFMKLTSDHYNKQDSLVVGII